MTTVTRPRGGAASNHALARLRRRRRFVFAGAVGAVLAIVVVIAVIAAGQSHSSRPASSTAAAPADVVRSVVDVPPATLAAIGGTAAISAPKTIHDSALTGGAKPTVLYVGAEFCPYCAAERWPLVQALSRFGTFSGLRVTRSPANDSYPDTATFSFHGATYHSDYLDFVARELFTAEVRHGSYVPLDKLTKTEAAVFHHYTNGYPFLYLGGRYVQAGVSFDPGVLQGKSWEDIAQLVQRPDNEVAVAVDGTANVLTAALCRLTGNQPAAVCTTSAVTSAAKRLPNG